MTHLPETKRHLPFGGAFSISDENIHSFLNFERPNLNKIFSYENIGNVFCDAYFEWIRTSNKNNFLGLNEFKFKVYSNGTTQTFDAWYIMHHSKRFRFFKGEYLYHHLSCEYHKFNWAFIEDDDLRENDVVIISLPFSNTGNVHKNMHEVLKTCDHFNVPVLIDCAFFGICENIDFDFRYKCIQSITFSLSKAFDCAYSRIGVRFSRTDSDDILSAHHKVNYINKVGAYLGLDIMKEFNPDYIVSKYKHKQLEYCKHLNLEPSNTVLFGLANEGWDEYKNFGVSRISFHKFLGTKEDLFYEHLASINKP